MNDIMIQQSSKMSVSLLEGEGGGGGSILEKNTPFEHQQAETNFREPVKTPCILLKI